MGKLLAALCLYGIASAAFGAGQHYEIATVAGSDRMGDGGPAVSAQISQPESLAVDSSGNLYIADPANHRVRKISPHGIASTLAGTGHEGFSGDGGPAGKARLREPYGVAVDAQGNVFIADTYNHRIRKVDSSGVITTIAGTGRKGTTGDGGSALNAEFMAPRNLAVDAAGNLYVSEFEGHRVRRIALGIVTTVAGTGVAGFNQDGPALLTQLASPSSLAIDGKGTLYLVDRENLRVRKLSNGFLTTVYGGRDNPGWPTGVACDRTGILHIAETERARVRKLMPSGELVTVAGTTSAGYDGDLKPAVNAKLAWPRDLAFDAGGALYISDLRRVRKVSPAGIIATIAGDGTFGFGGDGGPASEAYLRFPRGLALDRNGELHVADAGNHRVRRISVNAAITTVAGGGASADADKAPLATLLRDPNAVGFDPWGNLLISDSGNHRVRRLLGGILSTFAGTGQAGRGADGIPAVAASLFQPGKTALDTFGNLYLVDAGNHRILRITPAGIATVFAGNGTSGFGGDGGRAPAAQVRHPASVAVDPAGNVFVADSGNHRIRRIAPDGIISTVAGTGQTGLSPASAPALEARLSSPCAVLADGELLYVADNSTIHRLEAGFMTRIAGDGWAGFRGDGGPALAARLNNPCDLAIDKTGQIFVADSGNHRVRKLIPREPPVLVDPEPRLEPVRVFHAASLEEGAIAPGQIVTLIGARIGPAQAGSSALGTEFDGVRVLFDGKPAPLLYVSESQLNVQAPYALSGKASTSIEILFGGALRGAATVPVTAAAPGLFTMAGGSGQVVAVNQDGSINSPGNPAGRGSVVTFYATGEGQMDPPGVDGRPAEPPFPKPIAPVWLTIGGADAEIQYAGAAPGFVGLMQINARVPGAFAPPGMLPVVLRVGGAQSRAGVVIAVK